METQTNEKKEETKKPEAPKMVTSDRDVDFPSLGWAISAGAQRELPVDEAAQAQILANHHIQIIK